MVLLGRRILDWNPWFQGEVRAPGSVLRDALEPGSIVPLSGEHVPPPRAHAGELPRGRRCGGRKITFPGILQEYSKTLLRLIPLQQRTGPLQPCLWALLVSARPMLESARPLVVSAPLLAPPASLALSQPRVAVTESEPKSKLFLGLGGPSRWAALRKHFYRAGCRRSVG